MFASLGFSSSSLSVILLKKELLPDIGVNLVEIGVHTTGSIFLGPWTYIWIAELGV
jgi:hypothetical protein